MGYPSLAPKWILLGAKININTITIRSLKMGFSILRLYRTVRSILTRYRYDNFFQKYQTFNTYTIVSNGFLTII